MHTPAQSLDLPDFARPPNLKVDGSNWSIYSIRMTLFLRARGLYQHVETKLDPPDPHSYPSRHLEFKQRDAAAKLIIASTVPDSLLLLVHDRPAAKGMWDALAQELGPKGAIFRAGFERAFRERSYESPENLSRLREQLAGAGGTISHDSYLCRTIQSMDAGFSGGAMARADFVAKVKKDPIANWTPSKHHLDNSIVLACDYDPSRMGEQAESDVQPEVANRSSEGDSMRTGVRGDVTGPDDDGASEVRDVSQPPSPVSWGVPHEAPTAKTPTAKPALSRAGSPDTRHEVYSTGVPHHISPYRKDFVTFAPIEPKVFKSALGSRLIATGIGDLPIFVPNGDDERPILLKNAYYAPKLTATLVSLPQLSQEWEGDLSIGSSREVLTATSDEGVVASIPMCDGLHQVTHKVSLDLISRAKRMAFEFCPV
ncbi:hypothetical protein BOTBODRAFT_36628 [Botryobasidium botryosum FD-172 SS1]|uniref:Retrovirus-related Pol polyprotein from transposon TNT 1-94-like beta-barrel domain-containing protein n=1 Tax=Botryobasidium botryosum (strain FD-172 SS1) TaxID=930990 RepID=A0A067MDP5_BOTB1|nr:hypothetical protein BOTBODRAFT_36628 [Botryobasidium botryosum FD-172 SS1]